MRQRHRLALLAVLPLHACASGPAPASTIERLLRALEAADNRGDVDAVLACYADDIVLLPPGEHEVNGKDQVRERYAQLFARSTLSVNFVVESTEFDGALTVVRGRVAGRVASKQQPSGTSREVDDHFLMVLRCSPARAVITSLAWSSRRTP